MPPGIECKQGTCTCCSQEVVLLLLLLLLLTVVVVDDSHVLVDGQLIPERLALSRGCRRSVLVRSYITSMK